MTSNHVLETSTLTVEVASKKWNASLAAVRKWCKAGYVKDAAKSSTFPFGWCIPADAKRPIDDCLIREVLWQIVELQNHRIEKLDLTEWDIQAQDLDDYLSMIADNGFIVIKESSMRLTKKGLASIGRGKPMDGDGRQTVILTLAAPGAGAFFGSAFKQLIIP